MKKTITDFIRTFGVITIVLLSPFILVYTNIGNFKDDPTKGETWVRYEKSNPFEEQIKHTMYILDVKDGWIKGETNKGHILIKEISDLKLIYNKEETKNANN